MAACKHQTGTFSETITAVHTREVENGSLDMGSFNNEYGNGLYWEYQCSNCKKFWKWKPGLLFKLKLKWLDKLFEIAMDDYHLTKKP